MTQPEAKVCEELAQVASHFQTLRTGHAPKGTSVVLSADTLVVTLLDALTPAEKSLAASADGAAKVREFHRRLFASSMNEVREAIERITGRRVRDASAEIDTATGTVVHMFTSGAMVQVFELAPLSSESNVDPKPSGPPDDGGSHVNPDPDSQSSPH